MKNIIDAVLLYENRPSSVKDYESAKTHVERWLRQFDKKYHDAIVETMDNLCENSFITIDDYKKMCISKVKDPILTSNNPKDYWSSTFILNCQKNGESQSKMVEILKDALTNQNIFFCEDESKAERFFYIDDMAFTYGRIKQDIQKYQDKKIDVCPVISHHYDEWRFRSINQNSNIRSLYCVLIENRSGDDYKNKSGVFRPHIDSLQNQKFKERFEEWGCDSKYLRDNDIENDAFKNVQARKLCEEAFFIKGCEILARLKEKKNFKPLGISPYNKNWGFGGSVFSYRNCPNTSPIVIWWGGYENLSGFGWYPLMLRKGYNA